MEKEKTNYMFGSFGDGENYPKDTEAFLIKTLTDIQESVKHLTDSVAEMQESIKESEWVRIKNGGGREVSYKRQDFYQMIYDRPKDTFERVSWFSRNSTSIIQFLMLISVLYLSLHK